MIRQPIRSLTYDTCVEIAARRGEPDCILWPHGSDMQVTRNAHTRRAPYVVCTLAHGRAHAGNARVAKCPRNPLCVNPDHMEWIAPRLLDEDVICIRILAGRYTNGALASAFGVAESTIKRIRKGLAYDHVPSPSGAFVLDYWRRVVMQEDAACRT